MIELRALTESRQFQEAVELQKTVWGFDDIELLPVRLFVVATKVGGQAFGAYDGNGDGGLPALDSGIEARRRIVPAQPHAGRAGGISESGRRPHAETAAARGCPAARHRLVEWTFDPLELKNAFFNMERLGAIVRRYVENQYGTTTSPLHGGLPTDRCVAEWWLASPHARRFWRGAAGAAWKSASRCPPISRHPA
jgi:predicted GNAT superfamily acetyltransferase